MKYVEITEEKECLQFSLNAYANYILPKLDKFQTSVIHSDINESNILCANNPTELVGVIDLFDAVSSYSVFDGATFIAYMMILGCTNPLEYSEPAVSGYFSTFTLNEVEFDCLYYLVICKLAHLTIQGLRSQQVFPDNIYRTKVLAESRTALKIVFDSPKEEVERMWKIAQHKTAVDFQQ